MRIIIEIDEQEKNTRVFNESDREMHDISEQPANFESIDAGEPSDSLMLEESELLAVPSTENIIDAGPFEEFFTNGETTATDYEETQITDEEGYEEETDAGSAPESE